MKTTLVQNLIAAVLACSLTFTSPNLFGQSRVAVGPPVRVGNQPSVPVGPLVPAGNQPSVLQGLVPQFSPNAPGNGGMKLGQSYDGIDFQGSNCGCLPPDTGAAVGDNFVVETVNIQIRILDKTSGVVLLDEPLSTFFGAFSGGDPYVVYDDNADRWYVSAFDST